MRHDKRVHAWLAGVMLAAISSTHPAMAQATPLSPVATFLSPDIDFSKVCRVPPPDVEEKDWTHWDGSPVQDSYEDLYRAAKRYAGGTSLVTRNRVVARKLYTYLLDRDGPQLEAVKLGLGELLLDPSSGPVDAARGLGLIREAANALYAPALVTLGEYYMRGQNVPVDSVEATRLFRQAAALGSGDGAMNLLQQAQSAPADSRNPVVINELAKVTIGLLHTQLGRGDCTALRKIGRVYADQAKTPEETAEAVRWYEAAVRVRDVDAALTLAEGYRTGVGWPFDIRKAIELLSFAAGEGSSRAKRMLGEIYLFGDTNVADQEKALYWLVQAGESGDAKALSVVARIYRGDFGREPAYEEYVATLQKAVGYPDAPAQLLTELGRAYMLGNGVERDLDKAITLLERGANGGDPQALVELANAAIATGKFATYAPRVRSQLRSAANEGKADAMRLLSQFYTCGTGTVPDKKMARTWLQRAAAVSDIRSIKTLARVDAEGNPLPAAERFHLLRRAALLGDRESMVEIALAYKSGVGTSSNSAKAEYWRGRALAPGKGRSSALLALALADMASGSPVETEALLEGAIFEGDPSVTMEIGKLLLRGAKGVEKDRRRGIELLTRAARAGQVEAMMQLAGLAESELADTGRTGVEWLSLAGTGGNARAMTALAVNSDSEGQAMQWLNRLEGMPICDGEVMIRMATAYLKMPGERKVERARYWIDRARQMPDLTAHDFYLLSRAVALADNSESKDALDMLRQAANLGHVESMRALGRAGLAKAKDAPQLSEALDWLQRAYDAGDVKSAIDAAEALGDRKLTPEQSKQVLALVEHAAKAGSARAMRELGLVLQRGRGTAAEPKAGSEWLETAARAGDVVAMRETAMAYASGFGVPLSPAQSSEWLIKAAQAGDGKAMMELSAAYKVGFGVKPDDTKAKYWAEAAARSGVKQDNPTILN